MLWFIIVFLVVVKFYLPVFISIYEYVFFKKRDDFCFVSITTIVAVIVVIVDIPPLIWYSVCVKIILSPSSSSSPPLHEQY